MKIVMIGAGYVGLVSAACFAEFGESVHCVDSAKQKIAQLKAGEIPIYEPGLAAIVMRNQSAGRLIFTTSYAAVSTADVVFIAVGTPSRDGAGGADLTHLYSAVRALIPYLQGYTVVVHKSTAPVGTVRQVQLLLRKEAPDGDTEVASNPEFLREGVALDDFMHPDRVVIGVESTRAEHLLRRLYRPLDVKNVPLMVTSPQAAEMIKYVSNAFLATKISFINEIANLCEALNVDVHDVARGIGLDRRIGAECLHPGPGYGGSCLPKDTQALAHIGQENAVPLCIVEAGIKVNKAQRGRMIGKLREALGGNESGKTIAVLGLTYKPETDDMRAAPALFILPQLLDNGAGLRVHDPQGMAAAKALLPPHITYCDDAYSAATDADALLILTEWDEYRDLDLRRIKRQMRGNAIVDLRNIYTSDAMVALGFSYTDVGRTLKPQAPSSIV